MRFTEDGPSIPDELLIARDEGRVVFFCGAGVSRARANLPDFFGLADAVIEELGAAENSDAVKVLSKARELGSEFSFTGLISADRVFSLLERDFAVSDIQTAVAKCLKPKVEVDPSAHELLMRLARAPNGATQIVTTNFDRLFEDGGDRQKVFQPPLLPHPSRFNNLDGIVYLHGRVNDTYSGADGDGFVLSSADFGHAYLSEGWATEFFREILQYYVIVFVGYSADDPPIQYLLEGLRHRPNRSNTVYAFQAKESEESILRWQHKGCLAIPYPATDGHKALWSTLAAWANRADDPERWRQSVLDRAMDGPRNQLPHERGQIAHIVSTTEGAQAFATSKPPAEWLCVLDPACRLGRPGPLRRFGANDPQVNPFELYGLDSDTATTRFSLDVATRRSTTGPWDGFAINKADMQDVAPENLANIRGHLAQNRPQLPKRLGHLGTWIAMVASQPAAVWWWARQDWLHADYQHRVRWRLAHSQDHFAPEIRDAWQYVLESQGDVSLLGDHDWYDLKKNIDRDGWSRANARRFACLHAPYLRVRPGVFAGPVPPKSSENYRKSDLVSFEVECPSLPTDAEVPDQCLLYVVRELRNNVAKAVALSEEVDDIQRHRIVPLNKDDRPHVGNYQRTRGLSGCVVGFAMIFEKLVEFDPAAARHELAAWPSDDTVAFARLRMWAHAKPMLASAAEFCNLVTHLDDSVFWGSHHQRDLLLSLASRWSELSTNERQEIETRLLSGPNRWPDEPEESHGERSAWAILDRIEWLTSSSCELTFDAEEQMSIFLLQAPDWRPSHAAEAAGSRERQGGIVTKETNYTPLLHVAIDSILAKAEEMSGRSKTDFLTEFDPFAGLCAERPRRAYLALARAARNEDFPLWAWRTFFAADAWETGMKELSATVTVRICRLPDAILKDLLYLATSWLHKASKHLSSAHPDLFDTAIRHFVEVMRAHPDCSTTILVRKRTHRDWAHEAINSPVGNIVDTALDDARIDSATTPPATGFLQTVERCLTLPDDMRRYTLVLAARNLGWFYQGHPVWTEEHLLSVLTLDISDDQDAFWAGVFWNPQIASFELFHHMKDALLSRAKHQNSLPDRHVQSLAYLLTQAWFWSVESDADQWVSHTEFRETLLCGGDEFRAQVLWQFEQVLRKEQDAMRHDAHTNLAVFFDKVWPQQKAAKNARMTAHLCRLLLVRTEGFRQLIDIALPLMTKLSADSGVHLHFDDAVDGIIRDNPAEFLQLLHTVLPDDARDWPYRAGSSLDTICEVAPSLKRDTRVSQLRRLWNAR